jgi:hypothetical protein
MDLSSVPTLDDLKTALGAPEPLLIDAIVTQVRRDALIAHGADIASSRIMADVPRIYGLAHAVWVKATPEQRDALVGFSPDLLSVAVDRALALRELTSEVDDAGHADSAAVKVSANAATSAFARGLPRRDHLHGVLRTVAGADEELRSRIEVAVGTAEDAEALAKGMKRLVVIGREILHHKKGPLALRAKAARLSSGYLDDIDALADEVKSTGRAATGRATSKKAAQGDVDFLDGVNLHLLSMIISAFEAAHDVDPSIPRLTPIATRRALGKSRAKKKAEGAEEGKNGAGNEGAKPA